MLLVASCSDRGAGSKMSALHSPINHRAVLGNLAGQLLGFEVKKKGDNECANIKTGNMEPKPRGEDKVGQEITKLKKIFFKSKEKIHSQFNKFKRIWKDGEGKRQQERGKEKRLLLLTTARGDSTTIVSTMHSAVFLLRRKRLST